MTLVVWADHAIYGTQHFGKDDQQATALMTALPSANYPQRVFIDGTYTLCSGKSSGIERVVRNIIRHSHSLPNGQAAQVVIAHRNQFIALTDELMAALQRPADMQKSVINWMPKAYRSLAQLLCKLIPARKLRQWLIPETGHLGLFKLPHSAYEYMVRCQVARQAEKLQLGDGDLLILPDAYWTQRHIWSAVANARKNGAMVASIVYDLIPLTHPEFVGTKRQKSFLEYLEYVATSSDLIVAISATVRDQVRSFLPAICDAESHCHDIRSFQLGAELSATSGEVRSFVSDIFEAQETPYLMVATFDPRKNHRYLIDAFELLWKKRPKAKLCLIGRIGWLCQEILVELERHQRRNQQLFVFHDLSDAELQYCYRQSRGVILPSIVEGFGLPIVESLWYGQKTFASDTPIHREVGADDCSYFSLSDPNSLVEAIMDWETQLLSPRPALPIRQPLGWSESCDQLFDRCLDAYRARHETQPLRKAA